MCVMNLICYYDHQSRDIYTYNKYILHLSTCLRRQGRLSQRVGNRTKCIRSGARLRERSPFVVTLQQTKKTLPECRNAHPSRQGFNELCLSAAIRSGLCTNVSCPYTTTICRALLKDPGIDDLRRGIPGLAIASTRSLKARCI